MIYLIIGIAIIIIGIAIIIAAIYDWRRKKRVPTSTQITHGGVLIFSPVPVPSSAMDAIDEGISLQLEKSSAAHPDWQKFNSLADYKVRFIAPQATNHENDPGSPAIIVNGQQAAGTCDYTGYPTIVLPYQAEWNFLEYLKQSARNESEHIRLWASDQTLFQFYQGPNDIHPIFK